MSFRISGLDPDLFADLHAAADAELARKGVHRVRVESKPGAPCRVSLDDAEIGEEAILLSYDHQPADTPYRQQGPIFVRAGAKRFVGMAIIPPALTRRVLSLRGFSSDHMIVVATLTEGAEAAEAIAAMFANDAVAYIHAHYAQRGCFAALIERA